MDLGRRHLPWQVAIQGLLKTLPMCWTRVLVVVIRICNADVVQTNSQPPAVPAACHPFYLLTPVQTPVCSYL